MNAAPVIVGGVWVATRGCAAGDPERAKERETNR